MTVELKVPPIGESVVEATVGEWLKKEGDYVEKDALVVTLESEKATFELPAPAAGVLKRITRKSGDTVPIGGVLGELDDAAARPGNGAAAVKPAAPAASAPVVAAPAGPAARVTAALAGVDVATVPGTGPGGRVLKEDVQRVAQAVPAPAPAPAAPVAKAPPPPPPPAPRQTGQRTERVVRMTPLRRTVAARLVAVQNEAAILTTFNECDMSAVMRLREEYKETFVKKHGIKLGFMGFFVKAAVEALKAFPAVNSEVRGDDLVFKDYYDVGVAVGGGKGLVVPVLRNADAYGLADLEKLIADFGRRAQDGKLALDELQGGTFTISNGGVYGSMMSTPILNPPQVGILGMHNIVERAVVKAGQIVARPMMYLALSYDHRAIDGREAVQFLVRIKECVENPERMLLEV
jgi:2-oxoglutarate dehydrogenase E2 component (dihydrolipoamide succinyltransferase)